MHLCMACAGGAGPARTCIATGFAAHKSSHPIRAPLAGKALPVMSDRTTTRKRGANLVSLHDNA